LSWDDWENVDQDYDLILMDEDGNVLGKSEDPQDGQPGSMPVEGFLYEFDDDSIYTLAIENYDDQARGDAMFDLFIFAGEIHPDYLVVEASLSSPSDARGAFAVGAVHWADDVLEPYSSNGPTADGRIKPDLSAPSVVDSASYAPEAFTGTSAAAPHVAGAAALLLEAFPDFSPDQVAEFLQARAVDLGPAGSDNAFGAGRLNLGATPADATKPVETPSLPLAADIQPTSTPRALAETVAGLSGQTGQLEKDESDALVGVITLVGLCLACLGALLLVILIPVAIIWMVRKRASGSH
jgi:subtilisin family serine protease